MQDRLFRWGILGLGHIARKFAIGLQSVPTAELTAVGSRSDEKAGLFGADFGVARCYGSYTELAEDPLLDAVYIATPHPLHAENALACLRAGKAVLCEKSFTINAFEAEGVVNEARARNLFLMEAMWSRFLPVMGALRSLVAGGAVGDARMLQADFGFRAEFKPDSRLFNPILGGGALLDVGIYPVSLSSMLFGPPSAIAGAAYLGTTGVDESEAIVLTHKDGRLSLLSAALCISTPQEANLLGTSGRIRMHSPWWRSSELTLTSDGKDEHIEFTLEGNGYNYEAMEVERCVRQGLTESPVMPLNETLGIMHTMDTLREQWNLKYPME